MNLEFELKKQKLIRLDDEEIATYARNYIHVTFNFDKVWCDLKKYALFVTPNNNRYVVRLGYGKKITCSIPNEVLENAYFKISVFADDLLTSTQETVLVSASGYIPEIDDMDEDEVLETQILFSEKSRKKHFDEDIDERVNRFEIAEHPYC
jgi:hypothetical protein